VLQAHRRFAVVCIVVGFLLISSRVGHAQDQSPYSLKSIARPMANLRVCIARRPIPDLQGESIWSAVETDNKDKLCAELPFYRNETATARHGDARYKREADPVLEELKTMGEQGLIILRAREEVLEILSGQNQCAGWFERAEPDAARKFRSLRYRIEEAGPEYTLKMQGTNGTWRYQQPYVASSFEGAGAGSTITINGRGAFFQLRSGMHIVPANGGPEGLGASQLLHLDLYVGGTLRAQVVALLHEFSHVAGLLPADGGSLAGQELSTQNTQTMLGHCRAQVEAVGKHKIRKDGFLHPEDLPVEGPESGN
jgi:hypothetical protein